MRSPVSVLSINASNNRANQATSVCSGVAIVNVAPIVPQVSNGTSGFLTEPNNERKKCALTEFCTAWVFTPTAVATGLAPKYEAVRHIYLVGGKAKNGGFEKIFLFFEKIFQVSYFKPRLFSVYHSMAVSAQNSKILQLCFSSWLEGV